MSCLPSMQSSGEHYLIYLITQINHVTSSKSSVTLYCLWTLQAALCIIPQEIAILWSSLLTYTVNCHEVENFNFVLDGCQGSPYQEYHTMESIFLPRHDCMHAGLNTCTKFDNIHSLNDLYASSVAVLKCCKLWSLESTGSVEFATKWLECFCQLPFSSTTVICNLRIYFWVLAVWIELNDLKAL